MPGTNNPSNYSPTQYNVQTGGPSGQLNQVPPSATAGVALVSAGAASQPDFDIVSVAGGGTGLPTLTAYELLAGGTVGTGPLQSIAPGTPGQLLTSGGAGALPSFAAAVAGSQYFAAHVGPTISNVTGDGTDYNIILDTVDSNVGSAYSSSTGIFTAPTAGVWVFSASVLVSGVTVGSGTNIVQFGFFLAGTNKILFTSNGNGAADTVSGSLGASGTFVWPMSAGETLQVFVTAFNGTKTTSVIGTGGLPGGENGTAFYGVRIS